MPDQLAITVDACARCGDDHLCVVFTPFTNPPKPFTHFGNCPTRNEPILMIVIPATSRVQVHPMPGSGL